MEVSRTGLEIDHILMASVLVSAAHFSVLVSEVPALSTGSREPASRPNLEGLGLGHPCLGLGLGGLGLGGPGLDYNPDSHNCFKFRDYLPLTEGGL